MFGRSSGTQFSVRDLWNLRTFTVTGEFTSRIPAHGAAMFRIHPLGP
jgi:hypothetical protein